MENKYTNSIYKDEQMNDLVGTNFELTHSEDSTDYSRGKKYLSISGRTLSGRLSPERLHYSIIRAGFRQMNELAIFPDRKTPSMINYMTEKTGIFTSPVFLSLREDRDIVEKFRNHLAEKYPIVDPIYSRGPIYLNLSGEKEAVEKIYKKLNLISFEDAEKKKQEITSNIENYTGIGATLEDLANL